MQFFDGLQIRRAIKDYPVYQPPHTGCSAMLSSVHLQENFDFFLSEKETRIAALRSFLSLFKIELRIENSEALGSWMERYGRHLVAMPNDSLMCMFEHRPMWAGKYSLLNLINDIAIVAGQMIIVKNRDVYWKLCLCKIGHGTEQPVMYGKPCLFFSGRKGMQKHIYLNDEIYRFFSSLALKKRTGLILDPWAQPNAFRDFVETQSEV